MIIILESNLEAERVQWITDKLESKGLSIHEVQGEERRVLAIVGKVLPDPVELQRYPGIADVVRVSKPFKLASREVNQNTSKVTLGKGVVLGGPEIIVFAGPCSVEGEEAIWQAAEQVADAGARVLRGGAYKPRTSPYSFQGLGLEGLRYLKAAGDAFGMPVVSEVMGVRELESMLDYVDMLQIGARNMQNFDLLKEVGKTDIPILLKRGLSATIEELLMASEYILSGSGSAQVVLCERGVRTFETMTRNTFDLSAVPVLKELSHLPIIADPSHATGKRHYVTPMALAAVASGVDGVMIEVHPNPPQAMSDGAQSLYPEQFRSLMRNMSVVAPVVGRSLSIIPPKTGESQNDSVSGVRSKNNELVIGLQGVAGSNSDRAIQAFFTGHEYSTYSVEYFGDLFQSLSEGVCDYGMVPLENSLTGSIHENYDHLLAHEDLALVGEIKLRIHHSLVALPGVALSDIKRVLAHPQASAQCQSFLQQHPEYDVLYRYDTAGSAKELVEDKLIDAAAIAYGPSAQAMGLEVLVDGIESHPSNYTRFVIVTKQDPLGLLATNPNKCSIVFGVDEGPGSLLKILGIFEQYQVNLVKLESRPVQGKPWQYWFYADLEIPDDSHRLDGCLAEVEAVSPYYRCLGRYCSI